MYFTNEMMNEVENQQHILYNLIQKATKAYRRMGEVNFADEEARRIVYAVGKTIYDCGKGFGDAGAVIREISYLPQSVGSLQKNNRDSSPPPHDELRIEIDEFECVDGKPVLPPSITMPSADHDSASGNQVETDNAEMDHTTDQHQDALDNEATNGTVLSAAPICRETVDASESSLQRQTGSRVSREKENQKPAKNETQYICDECGEKFLTKKGFLIHFKTIHLGKKSFECDDCGKDFLFKIFLDTHKRVHTGEKPFVCDFDGCDKKYAIKDTLITHKRIHTGERPFACNFDGCNKKFTRKDVLNRHKRLHPQRTYAKNAIRKMFK